MKVLNLLLPAQHAPRWIVLILDMSIAISALYSAALLRFEFVIPPSEWEIWCRFLPLFFVLRFGSFFFIKTYAGIIRHTGISDARRILFANTLATIGFALANAIHAQYINGLYLIPFSIIGIEWLMTNGAMVTSRLVVKWLYLQDRRTPGAQSEVIIFGAGEAGIIAKQAIERELGENGMRIVAFMDDDPSKIGKKLDGIDILSSNEANRIFAKGRIDRLILSVQNLNNKRRQELVNMALVHGVRPLDVPPVHRWINGELSVRQIRELNIEDLLGRDTIKLNQTTTFEALKGKRIVITGAAGSIGSELVRQVLIHNPEALLAVDQAETPMHDLHLEVKSLGVLDQVQLQIGDVRDREQMLNTLTGFKPDIVFHAAAYKHVPLMEAQPWQAFETNVMGTFNTLIAAQASGCERFVLVSTDKAVNPTSVMGATKRMAEKVVRYQSSEHATRCIITRFGNVLGSNGSVIPLFRKQIESGGPITVTDTEVTRFFMTIPEAVSLVLEAGAMGTGDDLFVFDMGASVRILDLAHKMIALAGLELDKDIEVKITGLRPGEKLHEELLSQQEELLETHHPKIKRALTQPKMLERDMATLHTLLSRRGNHKDTIDTLVTLLPEYNRNVPFQESSKHNSDSIVQ